MKLDEAIPGSLNLAPKGQLLKNLMKDYEAMQGMMLENAPTFDKVVEHLQKIEKFINQ
ncbi:hypothetical protein [Spirulina subsalsa]|uniref:hypothetical protein n=1 Tax=Spirulina subsalsa TaxID=54311 RepID=UPI00030E45BA|nr:hypothetical protein [Spirulina subsalsa]